MLKRLLIIAREYNTANHWTKGQRLSPGCWVYASSYHNIMGNAGSEYVKLPGWELRPDAEQLDEALKMHGCTEVSTPR